MTRASDLSLLSLAGPRSSDPNPRLPASRSGDAAASRGHSLTIRRPRWWKALNSKFGDRKIGPEVLSNLGFTASGELFVDRPWAICPGPQTSADAVAGVDTLARHLPSLRRALLVDGSGLAWPPQSDRGGSRTRLHYAPAG